MHHPAGPVPERRPGPRGPQSPVHRATALGGRFRPTRPHAPGLCRRALSLGSALSALPLLAQAPPIVPPGFHAEVVARETLRASAVRGGIGLGDDVWLLAVGNRLEHFAMGRPPRRLTTLHDDIAFVCPGTTTDEVLLGELHTGTIRAFDLQQFTLRIVCTGPANGFDAVALPGDRVLLSANPLWPAAGAHAGIWLAAPGIAARELLPLQGPSGPLLVDHRGDLIAAELGTVVPPPPGAARLLRIPATRLQQAVAGGVLTVADATTIGTGFGGIYDLAEDDAGQLHATDPASAQVVRCSSTTLQPVGTSLDVGSGSTALGLQFLAGLGAPFRSYQPTALAPALLVARTDFWSHFELLRLAPQRPTLAAAPASPVPPGPVQLTLQAAPPGGLGFLMATMAGHVAERTVANLDGVPLWLALSTTSPLAVSLLPIDPLGTATATFTNPGGIATGLDFQVAVFGGPNAPIVGSSALLTLHLLP